MQSYWAVCYQMQTKYIQPWRDDYWYTSVGKGTLSHTITLSNASIDDFRYVRKKGKIYRSVLNSAARTNLDYAMLFYFILKFLI